MYNVLYSYIYNFHNNSSREFSFLRSLRALHFTSADTGWNTLYYHSPDKATFNGRFVN